MIVKKIPENFSPARILVIQLRQIGDVLLTTPSLRALRKRFPDAKVSFLAEPLPAKVLESNINVDEVIVRNPEEGLLESMRRVGWIRSARFDLVVDFLANPRSALIAFLSGATVTISYAGSRRSWMYTHTLTEEGAFSAERKLSILRVAGVGPETMELDMAVPERAQQKMDEWFLANGFENAPRPIVCLEPFMKYAALTYPAQSFVKICDRMAEEWGATVIVCWGPGREEEARGIVENARAELVLAPPTDLHELAALYKKADLWVGVDGGPRHIAASQGLPTFAVHGPSDDSWTPPGPRHLSVFKHDLPCVPCNKRHCPEEHNDCMNKFEPEEVFERLDEFKRRVLTTDEHR